MIINYNLKMGNTTNTRTLTNLINDIPYELFIHIMEYYDNILIIYSIGNLGKIDPTILSYMRSRVKSYMNSKELEYIIDHCV